MNGNAEHLQLPLQSLVKTQCRVGGWVSKETVRILVTASSLKGHAGKKATDRSKLDTRFFT